MSDNLLAGAVVQKLAWMLVHSLWQGTLIAIALALVIRLGRVQCSSARYGLCVLALVAMTLAPIATILSGNKQPSVGFVETRPTVGAKLLTENDVVEAQELPESPPVDAAPVSTQSTSILWQPWIVTVWFFGVAVLSGRLLCGFVGLMRLGRSKVSAPGWIQAQSDHFASLMKIPPPGVYISASITDAIVFGFVKPMVLLPAAWVVEMPVDMIEAIVAHELAHICRYDLWVNLLQRVTETLLFFHPAVWWVSQKIHIERELCCDEQAVELTRNPLRYAETLEHVARHRHGSADLRLAASIRGFRSILLDRIRNVLIPEKSRGLSPFLVAGGMGFLVAIVVVISSLVFREPLVQSSSTTLFPSSGMPSETPPALSEDRKTDEERSDVTNWWGEMPVPRGEENVRLSALHRPDYWAGWKDDTAEFKSIVAATVDGKPILNGQVLQRYSGYLVSLREAYQKQNDRRSTPAVFEQAREQFLQRDLSAFIQKQVLANWIESKLTASELHSMNQRIDRLFDKEVEKLKRELKVATAAELEEKLRSSHTSIAQIEEYFRKERVVTEATILISSGFKPVEDEQVAAYYTEHKDEFTKRSNVTWSEIRISFGKNGTQEEAREKLAKAIHELKSGSPFADVAKANSDGPTAREGGLWQSMEAGTLADQKLESLLFESPVGMIDEPYEGTDQLFLIMIHNRQDATIAAFDSVRDQIRSKLTNEKSRKAMEQTIADLLASAVIESKYPLSNAMR